MRSTLVAVAGLLPAVAVAGSALGAGPAPTSDASGPLPYAVFQAQRGTSAQLQLFVAPNGRRVRFAALSYRATCVNGSRRTRRRQSDDLGGIVIERGRRFIRRERFRAAGQRGRRVLSGRFARSWTTATVRYETRFTARDRARCHTILRFRPVRLDSTAPTVGTAPAVAPPAPVATPSPSPSPEPQAAFAGRYAGTTAAGDPIAFTLDAAGGPPQAISAAVTLACDDGEARRADLEVAVADSGSVRNNGRFEAAGTSGGMIYALTGDVNGTVATGRLTIESEIASSGGGDNSGPGGGDNSGPGSGTIFCQSARLSFSARRA